MRASGALRQGRSLVTPAGRGADRPARPWYRRLVLAYDRAYRLLHGLGRATAGAGPALRLEVRRVRRARALPDGSVIPRGARIGVLHLDNTSLAALHRECPSAARVGLELRRRLVGSLGVVAARAADGGPLADVRAFVATGVFAGRLGRLGFRPEPAGRAWSRLVAGYQRALIASLHPAGRARVKALRARAAPRCWITREALVARYAPAPARRQAAPRGRTAPG